MNVTFFYELCYVKSSMFKFSFEDPPPHQSSDIIILNVIYFLLLFFYVYVKYRGRLTQVRIM